MANIVNELDDILKAIRGEEVRQSIYRGMVGVNLQTERLEDVVGALNDAITAQTSVNVRSFVERVENAVWYKDGDNVAFSDCLNEFHMIPGYFYLQESSGSYTCTITFTLNLPKNFLAGEGSYELTPSKLAVNFLSIRSYETKLHVSPIYLPVDVVKNGALVGGVDSCTMTCRPGSNKLAIQVVLSGESASAMSSDLEINEASPGFVTVYGLGFSVAYEDPEET